MNQEGSQAYFTEILFHLTDRLFQEMLIHLFFQKIKQDLEWVRALSKATKLPTYKWDDLLE